MLVATLGPAGTCSEEVAIGYLHELGLDPAAHLVLCASFEAAAAKVIDGEAQRIIVPAAYTKFHDIMFMNLGQLHVVEMLYSKTPAFLLAGKRSISPISSDQPYRIASHPSPAPLLNRLHFAYEVVEVSSNSVAAWTVARGETNLCLTNQRALTEVNSQVDHESQLEVVEYFGSVDMVWAVLELGASDDKRSFWSGHFERSSDLNPEAVTQWLHDNSLASDKNGPLEGIRIDLAHTYDSKANSTKPQALFVDNDPSAFDLIPEVFTGWDWTNCQTSSEAAKEIRNKEFSLALVDVGLLRDDDHSDQSGAQLLSLIRKSTPSVHILMITGLGRSDDLVTYCFRMGALDYMRKPLDIDRLSDWLNLLARRWKSNQASRCVIHRTHPPNNKAM